jgi:polyisoprenoid-binding protein YceI
MMEPGHTEAEFKARHMMVTWVRGLFKDIHGTLDFEWDRPLDATFEGVIDVRKIWTGEPTRDAHLRSADFFDVEHYPMITFSGGCAERTGDMSFTAQVDLTIRDVTRTVELDVTYLGQWETRFWEGDVDRGSMRRVGFAARTTIDRHDFGVSWQDNLPGNGVVVSNKVSVALDVEAINLEDLERTGAIASYR